MADNVTIPATGSGTATPVIATDDVSGVHYQIVKVTIGALDAAGNLIVGGAGAVTAGVQRVTLASDDPAVTSLAILDDWDSTDACKTVSPQVTVTTDLTRPANATVYAANDAMTDTSAPSGGLTFTGCARTSGGSGIITDLVVSTGDDPATPLTGELFIFDTAPGTTPADNAAFAVADADIKTLVAIIPFALVDVGNNDACHVQNLNIGFTTVGSANLRFLVRVKAAYTPPGNSGVYTFRLKILQTD